MISARTTVAAGAACLLILGALVGIPRAGWATRAATVAPLVKDGAALKWKPVELGSPAMLLPPPPPAPWSLQLSQELWATSQARGRVAPERVEGLASWNRRAVPLPWLEFVRDRLPGEGTRAGALQDARTIATVAVSIYDALLIAQQARAHYGRLAPARLSSFMVGTLGDDDGNPSYPSGHAAGAQAAAGAIARLMPDATAEARRLAEEAEDARLAGGFCYPSDLTAGRDLGARTARAVLAARETSPYEAAGLRTWLRPRNAPATATPTEGRLARFPGEAPPAAWVRQAVDSVEAHTLSDLSGARVLAYTAMAHADATIAAADAYPTDPALARVVVAACVADMLGDIFPGDARRFDGLAARVEQASGAPPAALAAARALGEKVALSESRVYFFELERR